MNMKHSRSTFMITPKTPIWFPSVTLKVFLIGKKVAQSRLMFVPCSKARKVAAAKGADKEARV